MIDPSLKRVASDGYNDVSRSASEVQAIKYEPDGGSVDPLKVIAEALGWEREHGAGQRVQNQYADQKVKVV